MAPQAQSSNIPPRLPLIAPISNRDSDSAKDAKLVNCYTETQEDGITHIYKRAGLSAPVRTKTGTGRGQFKWQNNIYEIFGATVYKNGTALTGTVDTTNGVYRWGITRGATPYLVLGNGVTAYTITAADVLAEMSRVSVAAGSFVVGVVYTIRVVGTTDFTLIGAASNTVGVIFTATGVGAGTGTATRASIASDGFVKGWAFLDGTLYAMDASANIWGSDLNVPTAWDPLNKIVAQVESDAGVAIAKQLVYIIAFKENSTEIFYDAGNPSGSPLGPVQGSKADFGCVSAETVQDIDGVLFWVSARSGGIDVVKMEQIKAQAISSKPVERLLEKSVNFATETIFSWQLKTEGHSFYVLTFKTANITLAYDIVERRWYHWSVNGNYVPIVASSSTSTPQHLVQGETDGNVYYMGREYTNDNGSVIVSDIITPNFDGGSRRRKHLKALEVVGDQVAGSELKIRVSDDDYQTWSNFRAVSLENTRPILTDCGTFVKRALHLRHESNTRMRISAVELQMDLGVL